MNYSEIRTALEQPIKDEFALIKELTRFASLNPASQQSRDLVLLALEKRESFVATASVLNSITQHVGYYPYTTPESFREAIAYEFHRPLDYDEDIVFHKEQMEVYQRLLAGDNIVLSAPTSFGKSKIIDALISLKRFKNIAIIVPTLALIDETRRRLQRFSQSYKLITHPGQEKRESNLYILTAERAVSIEDFPSIDFFVIDEFYKIDGFGTDADRTVALNIAFQKLLRLGGQFYMLGPNIAQIPEDIQEKYRCYFYPTRFATVLSREHEVLADDPMERLAELCAEIEGSTLIFCKSPARVGEVARHLVDAHIGASEEQVGKEAADWASQNYHPEWIWPEALTSGIGIHHGKLPRSLSQVTVQLFNEGIIRFLICTSTLIEGVNTSAKNIIVFDNEIARRKIDFFTFNNIKGRSGRMFQHFVGNVYLFADPPEPELPFVDFPLVSQRDSVPDSLLIQIDPDEQTDRAKDRLAKYLEQDVLPLGLLKQNATVDPETQIELAREIEAMSDVDNLIWQNFPTSRQLYFVCDLLWRYFLTGKRQIGVYSGRQLAFRLGTLSEDLTARERILNELEPGQYAAKSADEAVERVLTFDRNWAQFEVPKYLTVLSSIQEHVLKRRRLPFGDYSFYASKVEALFKNPVLVALDEYGLPIQLVERINELVSIPENLDDALDKLKSISVGELPLGPFEKKILEDFQSSFQ